MFYSLILTIHVFTGEYHSFVVDHALTQEDCSRAAWEWAQTDLPVGSSIYCEVEGANEE